MAPYKSALMGLFVLAATNAFMIPSTMSLPDLQGDEALTDLLDSLPKIPEMPNMPEMPKMPEFADLPSMPKLPEIHIPVHFPDLHIPSLTELTKQSRYSLYLPCPGCSMIRPGQENVAENDVPNDLVLHFGLDESGKTLLLNDLPFYPLPDQPSLFLASQTPTHSEEFGVETTPTRHLSYTAGISVQPADDGTNHKLVDVFFKVKALDEERVDIIPVSIRLVENEHGQLYILDVAPAASPMDMPPTHSPFGMSHGFCHGPRFLCKFIGMIEAKIAAFRTHLKAMHPCPGMRRPFGHPIPVPPMFNGMVPPTHGGVPKFTGPDGPFPGPKGEYIHYGHHGHHGHHHHRLHKIAMAINNFIVGFVVPVLVGIIAGMTASLIGMAAGTTVAWLWIRFVRGGKRGPYARVPQQDSGIALGEDDVNGEDLKATYVEGESAAEEAPPVYVEKE